MPTNKIIKSPLLLFTLLMPFQSLAHTINQDMEQMYGTAYLPIFIFARILPFIGLGMVSYDPSIMQGKFQNPLPLLIALGLGVVLAFMWHDGHNITVLNQIEIMGLGIILLISHRPIHRYAAYLAIIIGISSGYELGLYIEHSESFRWIYLTILGSGVFIYLILQNIQFNLNPTRRAVQIAIGIILILSSILLILLF